MKMKLKFILDITQNRKIKPDLIKLFRLAIVSIEMGKL